MTRWTTTRHDSARRGGGVQQYTVNINKAVKVSIQVYCRFSAVSHSMSGRDLMKDSVARHRARTKAEKRKNYALQQEQVSVKRGAEMLPNLMKL